MGLFLTNILMDLWSSKCLASGYRPGVHVAPTFASYFAPQAEESLSGFSYVKYIRYVFMEFVMKMK